MKPYVTTKGLRIIAIVTVICAIATFVLVELYGYPSQARNMAAAERHIPILLPLLQKDSRFTNFTVSVFTGQNGSLIIDGQLYSEKDLQDLKKMVDSSSPPVAVVYNVRVYPPEYRQELEKPVTPR
jgi:hypothetical protein